MNADCQTRLGSARVPATLIRRILGTAAIAVSVSLTSCNGRFAADFEADSPGAPPAAQPPGPPDDRIQITSSDVDDDGIVIRVSDEPGLVAPGDPHRFMSLIHESNPGSTSAALLKTAAMATGMQSIYLQWEQVLDGGGSGKMAFFADAGDDPPDDPDVCWLHTGNDSISIESGTESAELSGFDTHSVHTVRMRFDRSPRRAVIQVSQDGSTTELVAIETADLPAPAEGERFVIQIEHEGQADSAYRFNRFEAQERDPN